MTFPKHKTALVTGSSSGIGLASAKALKEAGFTVYASARREASLETLARQGFRTLKLDVTREATMVVAVEQLEAEHGAVDVLVNNAGYGLNGPVEALSLEAVRQQFETNVFGLVRLSQLVLPGMRCQGAGRIINIGSIGGTFSTPGAGAYHASKWAVEAFTDSLRAEVGGFGVDVALIQPTGVYTDFDKKLPANYPDVPANSAYAFFIENHKKVATDMFQGRNTAGIVKPEQVAKSVLHAATARRPRSRYKVGASAHLYGALRKLLSDRAWDRMMLSQFPVQPKKNLAKSSNGT